MHADEWNLHIVFAFFSEHNTFLLLFGSENPAFSGFLGS